MKFIKNFKIGNFKINNNKAFIMEEVSQRQKKLLMQL